MLPCRPQEHHIIDRDICDLAVCCDLAGVGQDIGLLYMIILILHEGTQRTVDGVILAGLDLNRDGGQAVVIVDQVNKTACSRERPTPGPPRFHTRSRD